MKLAICVATMHSPKMNDYPGDITGWIEQMEDQDSSIAVQYNNAEKNLGVVGSYQSLYERAKHADILMYIHDDVICREKGWDQRVLKEFEDLSVGIVGFGGATQHGSPDLYKTPYRLQQLGRCGYLSNVDDAEVHGSRFTGSADVAVLDGYCLIVRRELLDRIGGWIPIRGGADFFCYDYALCALVRRHRSRIRCIGIRCHHRGGATSVQQKDSVKDIISQDAYDRSHRWFYDNFKDVMPARVL